MTQLILNGSTRSALFNRTQFDYLDVPSVAWREGGETTGCLAVPQIPRLVDDELWAEVAETAQGRPAARRDEFQDSLALLRGQLAHDPPEELYGAAGDGVAAAVCSV